MAAVWVDGERLISRGGAKHGCKAMEQEVLLLMGKHFLDANTVGMTKSSSEKTMRVVNIFCVILLPTHT